MKRQRNNYFVAEILSKREIALQMEVQELENYISSSLNVSYSPTSIKSLSGNLVFLSSTRYYLFPVLRDSSLHTSDKMVTIIFYTLISCLNKVPLLAIACKITFRTIHANSQVHNWAESKLQIITTVGWKN